MTKKIIISISIIFIIVSISITKVYAADDDGSWMGDAFQATYDFFTGDDTESDDDEETQGWMEPILNLITNFIKAANRILLVALGGLSIISLSIVGVRYIMSGTNPKQRETAKKQLHTVFLGMLYGFGAFMIFSIAMAIVRVIVSAFNQG